MSGLSNNIDNKIFEVKNYLPNGNSAYFKCFKNTSDVVCNEIKKGNIWEKELHNHIINFNLDENSVILEAGTHIGSHTIFLSNLAKKIYGFEPFPETHKLAIENLKLNNINNVILSSKALSDENKTIEVEYHNPTKRNIGGWGIHFTKDKEYTNNLSPYISIKTITIDSLKLDKLDLVKLDVEGNELKVINGGIKTIEKYRPIIILENWSNYPTIDINKTKCQFNILINIGYKIERIGCSPDFIFSPISCDL